MEGDLTVVRWRDNGIVQLASTFVGIGVCDTVKRWSESTKSHLEVERPEIVKIYNEFMGGVGKLDFLIALYRIHAKTKKWPVGMMLHFVDLSLANSWPEYREAHGKVGTPQRRICDPLQFCNMVAETLINAETNQRIGAGRPRNSRSPDVSEPREKRTLPML